MVLAPRLELRQGQALVMTPQLQQAIKLLQLSNLELSAYVDSELERNPLLEMEETPDGGPDSPDADPAAEAPEPGEHVSGEHDLDFADDTRLPDIDADVAGFSPDDASEHHAEVPRTPGEADSGWSSMRPGQGSTTMDDPHLEARFTRERTLAEHLAEQLAMAIADPARRLIGLHLIDEVDEAGYFGGDITQIAERLGAQEAVVLDTLKELQGLEPAGVFARNLGECLAIQLAEKDRLDPAMQALLDNLPLLAKRDLASLVRICGVDREDLAEMIDEVRRLNPKPGLAFGSVVVQPVVPDVFVREDADGGWLVELNSETLPRVLVNKQYYATVSGGARKADEKTYLADCFASANWLVKSLDQRARTILRVAREIVRQQDGFLAYGIQHLKPLNLKTVAEAISMHESTVSRVTSNKYMATSRGVFEMKYFFTSAIASTAGGDAHSAESVRHRIRDLIANESPETILSDDRIVEMLRDSGIDIARRTVAKYREAMNIPSSVQRRREKCEAR